MTDAATASPRPVTGYLGFALGAAALLLVLVHFWAGPFAPKENVAVSIGELAAEIRESAKRALAGAPQPAPQAAPWDIDRLLKAAAAALAGLAAILGLAGLVRREAWRPSAAAVALGVGAVTFQLYVWTILVLVGAVIIFAVVSNLDAFPG